MNAKRKEAATYETKERYTLPRNRVRETLPRSLTRQPTGLLYSHHYLQSIVMLKPHILHSLASEVPLLQQALLEPTHATRERARFYAMHPTNSFESN